MKSIFEEFIRIMKEKTPEETNTVDLLTTILPMSKESAYRRLRGEIDFTFSEIMKIAQKLDISLDNLNKTELNLSYKIKTFYIRENHFIEDYIQWLEIILSRVKEFRYRPEHYTLSVNNNLPFLYLFNYEKIVRIYLYKWIYQRNNHQPIKISEINIPPIVLSLNKMILKEIHQMRIHFIFGQEVIKSLVNDIKYFHHLDLISKQDVSLIKKEIFSLLNDMEYDAIRGKNQDMPCSIHITNLNFESDFVLFHSSISSKISFRLFEVNFCTIEDTNVVNEMKNWTDMLLKSSTSISFSGEKKRIEYFQRQRNILDTL